MQLNKIFLFFFCFTVLLYFGKFILLPLSLALFIYVITKSITRKFLDSFENYLNFKLNEILALFLIFIIIFSFFYFFWIVAKSNLLSVRQNASNYQENLEQVLLLLSNLPINNFFQLENFTSSINLLLVFSKIINNLSSLAGNFSFILIFFIFFIVEEKYFIKKVELVYAKKQIETLKKINNDVFTYFQIKSLTSLIVGILTYLFLLILDNDLAPTFGFLSFFLNFIPFIGSILSIILPIFFSITQNLNFLDPLITFFLLTLTQIYVGNILEPKLMGKTLNISPLVMIIFLAFMGKIWGIAGMFLSVPLLVVILIVLRRIKSTQRIAILLSDKGKY